MSSESSDDKRSMGQSVSSTDSSTQSGMSLIRFNAFEEMLFTVLYMFHKEKRFPMFFWLMILIISTLNGIGISFRYHDWPIGGQAHKLIGDFFSLYNLLEV
ncbi:MAG: hypothetical protein EZS28_036211 [Streblomastix strix]|uniref:Uncharacterized protein n=1 Tax=Streblomastix strix TaxID=222440 RepID=A0A5J4UEB0_9EUKA|nr:MAG: hypothetical protein EZS28_036211 [Streblomastix strix]